MAVMIRTDFLSETRNFELADAKSFYLANQFIRGTRLADWIPDNVIVGLGGRAVLLDFVLIDVQRLMDPLVVPEHLRRR